MPLQILQLRPSIQKPKVSFFLTLPRRYCKAVRLWWWIPIKNADLLGIGELNAYNLQSFKSKMCVIYIHIITIGIPQKNVCLREKSCMDLDASWCFLPDDLRAMSSLCRVSCPLRLSVHRLRPLVAGIPPASLAPLPPKNLCISILYASINI